jgi:CRP/FNR family transcriptional regulator, cyclic AMP receptor protein
MLMALPGTERSLHEVFARNAWFMGMPEAARAALWPLLVTRRLDAGQGLFRRGDASSGWFGVVEGALEVSGSTADGKRVALALLEPGNWVGEVSALDGRERTHDVVAHGPTLVAWLPQPAFEQWMQQHPAVAQQFIAQLCARLRTSYAFIEELQTLPKPALIARRLLLLASSFGEPEQGSTQLKVRLSQEDIATLLGLSRQRVNQELQRLARLGIAEASYGDVRIHDLEALRREAQG